MELIVILHTSVGDVRTAYPMSKKADAFAHFDAYLADGKRATLTVE